MTLSSTYFETKVVKSTKFTNFQIIPQGKLNVINFSFSFFSFQHSRWVTVAKMAESPF
jgi:hypothetical protein